MVILTQKIIKKISRYNFRYIFFIEIFGDLVLESDVINFIYNI